MRPKFLCGRRIMWALHLSTFVLCISAFSEIAAQPLTHTVRTGETLYSISRQYFGTPEFWPKLWEMNPFVTNPHLLKPGDLIRVGTLEPAALKPPDISEEAAPEDPPDNETTGIHVGGLTPLNARGFLSKEEKRPWCTVGATDSKKLLLAKGDLLFLNFKERDGIKTGDEFMVFRPLSRVRHVITGEDEGVLYSARAKVILRERTLRNMFRAEIQENYTDVNLGDLVLPFEPTPSCMIPLPSDTGLRGVVIASEQQRTVFGRNSIVYLDSGRNKGLLPGSMLELVRFRNVPDPAVSTDLSSLFYEFFQVKTLVELYEKITRETMVYEKMVGRMIVLDAGPDTATALVLSTNESLQVGAFFRGSSSWANTDESSTPFLSCPARQ